MEFTTGESTKTTLQAFDNIHGGKTVTGTDGTSVSSQENVFGGQSFYENHQEIAHTKPNVFGGVDVYEDHSKTGYSREEVDGTMKMYNADNSPIGEVYTNADGSTQAVDQGQVMMTSTETSYGLNTVMHYDDPLAHVQTYMMAPFYS
jgi:hypothetical protein